MKKYNKQNNIKYSKGFTPTPNLVSGFTIIEAMIAIFILSVSVVSMLGVNATSASFARYANNELTANYLAQEAVDSIRNSRDTIAFQNKTETDAGEAWANFLDRYGYNAGTTDKCFNINNGCYLEMEDFDPSNITTHLNGDDVVECPTEGGCPLLKYNSDSSTSPLFYKTIGDSDSIFRRKVKMEMMKDYEVKITVDVSWDNTGNGVMKSRSLEMYLLNWKN